MVPLEDAMPGEDSHIGMDTGPHGMLFLGFLPRGPQRPRATVIFIPSPEKPSASAVASPSSGFPNGWVLRGLRGYLSPWVLEARKGLPSPFSLHKSPVTWIAIII